MYFVSSLVSARDADIGSRDRERVACERPDTTHFLITPHFHFKASHVRRTCEFTKKFLAISFEESALLRMRKIRDDVNDARAAIA